MDDVFNNPDESKPHPIAGMSDEQTRMFFENFQAAEKAKFKRGVTILCVLLGFVLIAASPLLLMAYKAILG